MSAARLVVRSPYDQEVVAELPFDDAAAAEVKLARAVEAQREWRRVPVAGRVTGVREGLERFRRLGEETAAEVSRQMGKPLAQARREVETMAARAEHMLEIAESALAPEDLPASQGTHLRIVHDPKGVVLDIAAWNYPLLIAVNVVVPALLAGNAVLLKHSARTPLAGRRFAAAFGEGALAGLVADLVLTHDATARRLADPRLGHVAFTGSVEGGHAVAAAVAAAGRFIDVGLELGGKDPAYVAADADLEAAASGIVDGACYNAGQSCCAVERVYVHRSLHARFLERARELLAAYRLGDPMADATTMGPLASASALDLLEAQVGDATARGARLVLGGRRVPGERGNFFPPTLLDGVPNLALAMQEESFGPILPVLAVADDDEALRLMDETRFGLTASVWTRDHERIGSRELEFGTVYQNRCDVLEPALPWTGARSSGRGSTLSRYGFHALTRRKALNFRDAG